MAHHTLDTTALREPFPEDDALASVQLRWKPVRALDLFYGALRPAVAFVSFPEHSITLDRIMVRYAMAGPCRGLPPPAVRHGQASPRASATERATAPRLEPASAHSRWTREAALRGAHSRLDSGAAHNSPSKAMCVHGRQRQAGSTTPPREEGRWNERTRR